MAAPKIDMKNRKSGSRVIFQRFSGKAGGRRFPYPPLYREPDTDYICFTDDVRVHSSVWKIQMVENPVQADLEPYLKGYAARRELKPEQIQMGELLSTVGIEENVITVPLLEELPLVTFEPEKLVPTSDGEGNYVYQRNPVYSDGKYDGRPLLLTIGVPVSNQINTIERCLSHIKPLLEQLDAELLVIDTGSTDGTVEVCKRYGARIITHPWCDNMSAVRNDGIYHARGEWYLSIDDDEWFEDVEDILQFFKQGAYRNYDQASYIQRNYMDSDGTIYEDYHTLRMARITPQLHFEGRIHDALATEGASNRACVLHSCAQHYGFVRDDPGKTRDKFMRNTSILLQDVYEYPEDLRYLFQLANEYRCIDYNEVAVKLFVEVITLAMETGDKYHGGNSAVMLIACLYEMYDRRLFQWAKTVEPLFSLSAPEHGFIAWCQEGIAFQFKQSPEQILEYYIHYKENLELYRKDPAAGQYLTFYGLATVEQELYIMDAEAMAFCSYLALDREEEALAILPCISMDVVKDRRANMLTEGLAAGDKVYKAIWDKLTAMQWEEWSEEILSAVVTGLERDSVYGRLTERMSDLLARLSISAIISWFKHTEAQRNGIRRGPLYKYAMECEAEGCSVQELCFCAWTLKEAYVENRKAENSREILYQYLFVLAVFAERFYSPELLLDAECQVIPPDIRAAYRMAVALADGKASHENVMLLRQALAIFPVFHEEIRTILTELNSNGR